MVSFGAVVVDQNLDRSFYGKLKPISKKWIPEALNVSGHTREETMTFSEPEKVMQEFKDWINEERNAPLKKGQKESKQTAGDNALIFLLLVHDFIYG